MLRRVVSNAQPFVSNVAFAASSSCLEHMRFCSSSSSSLYNLQCPLQSAAAQEFSKDRFNRNLSAVHAAYAPLKAIMAANRDGVPEIQKQRQLHISRNKLLVRDRVKALLDRGTDFFEFSPLAGHNVFPNEYIPAGGIVTGVGVIHGTRCVVMANDATVKGGIYFGPTLWKQLRAQKIAQQNSLPCIYLVDSGGGNLERQADGFADEMHFGRLFYNQATMSSLGIPQISCVMGSCTAGGAYIPSMSDETVIVKESGTIFLGGPQLVYAATKEKSSAEDLGGGEMHCSFSGVADHLATDDRSALERVRRIVKHLGRRHDLKIAAAMSADGAAATEAARAIVGGADSSRAHFEPRHDATDIAGFVDPIGVASSLSSSSDDLSSPPVHTHGVLSRLVDRSEFDEFKALYGPALTTGFAEVAGFPVGIVIDNGTTLGEREALKGAHFTQMCSQRKIPMLFLQGGGNFQTPGAASSGSPSTDAAVAARTKHAGKFISAVATSHNVPKITVVIRGCIADGSVALCGRSMEPRMLFLWPTAKLAMSGDAASLSQQDAASISTATTAAAATTHDAEGKETKTKSPRQPGFIDALKSSAHVWDDGVIDPALTRSYVAEALQCVACKDAVEPAPGEARQKYGVFRM